MKKPPPYKRIQTAMRTRGAAMVEYVLIVSFVAVPTVVGFTLGSQRAVTAYELQRAAILKPIP